MSARYSSFAIATLFTVACTSPAVTPSVEHVSGKTDETQTKEDAERWTASDSPASFDPTVDYVFANLPLNGEASRIPWASSYWPVYEDSINHKWDGAESQSISAKYGAAFNVTGVEEAVSSNHGIDNNKSRKECAQTSECDSKLGEACAKKPGAEKGRCIPTWWGICHAWAPAAIMNPEPKYPVTVNGVTFKVNDIKALVTLAYDKSTSKFVSLRCEESPTEPRLDENGRASSACRDSNAGTFHVLLANYLGKRKESFVYDRTWHAEVWNQPLRGYRVTSQKEVTAAEANRVLGVTSSGGVTTKKTITVPKGEWVVAQEVTVAEGTNLKVTSTGTGDGDLFVQFGSAPTSASNACKSTGNTSAETCELVVPAGATKAFVSVLGYSEATVDVTVVAGGRVPTSYAFNGSAAKLIQVKAEVDYIGESSSETDGNLAGQIDRYTHTDHYDYILELDAAGKIVGGEWIGASKLAHPDFLWLPTGMGRNTSAGGKITWANIKSLLDKSLLDPNAPPQAGVKTVKESFTLAKGTWKHYGPFAVGDGKKLTAALSGSGDADLYVRKGGAPSATQYECRPYANGSAENCESAGGGPVFVSVFGYTEASVTLEIVYEEGANGPITPPPATTHLNESGNVGTGEMKVFQVAVQAGKKIVVRTTAAADVDLYVRLDSAPTTGSFLQRAWTPSGNETLTVTPTSSGTLFVGVHGYAASAFTLVTAD